jgi:DNA-binding response OmpR family regulator
LLAESRFRVVVAADAIEAAAAIAKELPSVVILDLVLPETTGFELLEQWRTDARTAGMKVLILTSKDLSAVEEEWLRARADGLFSKSVPWNHSLLEALEQSISTRQGRRSREAAPSLG